MSERTPSRLPAAFVRVSKCPICRYSLKDLADDAPCPECGTEIQYDILCSPEFVQSVSSVRTWCMFGIIGWIITIFVIWVYQMLILALRNTYGSIPSTDIEYAAVWLRCAIVLAPLAILFASFRGAKSKLYRESICTPKRARRFKNWVVVIALPGILGGVGGCLLMSYLVTMAV